MPITLIAPSDESEIIPIHCVSSGDAAFTELDGRERAFASTSQFSGHAGDVCFVYHALGRLEKVIFAVPEQGRARAALSYGLLANKLPSGTYRFKNLKHSQTLTALALLLEAYRFDTYKSVTAKQPDIALVVEDEAVRREVNRLAQAHNFARDLINTPTNDMGTEAVSNKIFDIAHRYGATFRKIVGDSLLEHNFPLIHAVGRASIHPPHLIDVVWGDEQNPKVTLVGKGVVFDTGGLNLKSGTAMSLMKKDMAGAANLLALAQMIMDANLPVRLRLLVPAVENSLAGNAFRPGDILRSRAQINVEISNTDAEGRLILADALTFADEEAPDLLIDMATLTGAARIALGPEIVPFFTHNKAFANTLEEHAEAEEDPVWRLPLWEPYQAMLKSPIADVNHASAGGFAGSITAALFLDRFVKKARIWAHFDLYGWTLTARPARPKGGEAQAIRALYSLLQARY